MHVLAGLLLLCGVLAQRGGDSPVSTSSVNTDDSDAETNNTDTSAVLSALAETAGAATLTEAAAANATLSTNATVGMMAAPVVATVERETVISTAAGAPVRPLIAAAVIAAPPAASGPVREAAPVATIVTPATMAATGGTDTVATAEGSAVVPIQVSLSSAAVRPVAGLFQIDVLPDPTPCEYGPFSLFSTCSRSCDGTHIRTRQILAEPINGGTPCVARSLNQTQACQTQSCVIISGPSSVDVSQSGPYTANITGMFGNNNMLILNATSTNEAIVTDLIVEHALGSAIAIIRYTVPEDLSGDGGSSTIRVSAYEPVVDSAVYTTFMSFLVTLAVTPRNCELEYSPCGRCSKTCDSGVCLKTAFIAQQPRGGGDACPVPLPDREEPCNTQPCAPTASRAPSPQPSLQPTRLTTAAPSISPSPQPSLQPTRLTTAAPSISPSPQPSSPPTSTTAAAPFIAPYSGSCAGQCGKLASGIITCSCDAACTANGDCCPDYEEKCGPQPGSCRGVCDIYGRDRGADAVQKTTLWITDYSLQLFRDTGYGAIASAIGAQNMGRWYNRLRGVGPIPGRVVQAQPTPSLVVSVQPSPIPPPPQSSLRTRAPSSSPRVRRTVSPTTTPPTPSLAPSFTPSIGAPGTPSIRPSVSPPTIEPNAESTADPTAQPIQRRTRRPTTSPPPTPAPLITSASPTVAPTIKAQYYMWYPSSLAVPGGSPETLGAIAGSPAWWYATAAMLDTAGPEGPLPLRPVYSPNTRSLLQSSTGFGPARFTPPMTVEASCTCQPDCLLYQDCCEDFVAECYVDFSMIISVLDDDTPVMGLAAAACRCDDDCRTFSDCCGDYDLLCLQLG